MSLNLSVPLTILGLAALIFLIYIFLLKIKKPAVNVESKLPIRKTNQPVARSIGDAEAQKAQEELKVLLIERDIASSALTMIYEAETKGILTEDERDQLAIKYKDDIKKLEEKISRRQRIVDLYELEKAREDLVKSFYEKLDEIEKKINELKLTEGAPPLPEEEKAKASPTEAAFSSSVSPQASTSQVKEETCKERLKTKVEEKIEAIREEVLKAIEKLEQIEAEG